YQVLLNLLLLSKVPVRSDTEIKSSILELGSLTTANLMEKVRGLQNLAYQLGLDECKDKPSEGRNLM
ncbi:hypothetical protein U0070_001467, partial [Myodes glareolus]